MRPTVLHHRQDAGRPGTRTMLRRPIRIAMPAVETVEVARLVRRMDRHSRETRLLEIENARARDSVDKTHQFTNSPIHQFTNSPTHQITRAGYCVMSGSGV